MMRSPIWLGSLAILGSAICWYLAFDLSIHAWWALWLAPIPVIYLSLQRPAWQAYGLAFFTVLIGRLSWFSFLHGLLPLAPLLLITILLPAIFGLIILAVRKLVRVASPPIAVLGYPVMWTALEFLQFQLSRDGTAGSIAYTQADVLPFLQIASITGILGITFLLCLFPSAIALGWYYHRRGKKVRGLLFSIGLLYIFVFVFGLVRLSGGRGQKEVSVGLAAIPMTFYKGKVYDRDRGVTLRIAGLYLQQVRSLAAGGSKVIVLPEKGIAVSDSTESIVKDMFQGEARRSGVTIIMGVNCLHADRLECRAWVFSNNGDMLLNYNKVHLFEGEAAEGFIAGQSPGSFSLNGERVGVAICKDLDFEDYSRLYRQMGASILCVPAWDFNRDGWVHSRIAIMGAVENGYSLVRDAQQGRLTISDDRGRVVGEASSERNGGATLAGTVGLSARPTLFNRWGEWFGWLNLLAAAGLLLSIIRKPR